MAESPQKQQIQAIYLLCALIAFFTLSNAQNVTTDPMDDCGGDIACYILEGYNNITLGDFNHTWFANSTVDLSNNTFITASRFGIEVTCNTTVRINASNYELSINGVIFSSCGPLVIAGASTLRITDTTIRDVTSLSTSSFAHGAITIDSCVNVFILDVVISDNMLVRDVDGEVLSGGGMYISRADVVDITTTKIIRNSIHTDNLETMIGGGLDIENVANFTMNACLFENNTLNSMNISMETVSAFGGALNIGIGVNYAFIENTAFVRNSINTPMDSRRFSGTGCGISTKSNLLLTSCAFNLNECNTIGVFGQTIYANNANVTLSNTVQISRIDIVTDSNVDCENSGFFIAEDNNHICGNASTVQPSCEPVVPLQCFDCNSNTCCGNETVEYSHPFIGSYLACGIFIPPPGFPTTSPSEAPTESPSEEPTSPVLSPTLFPTQSPFSAPQAPVVDDTLTCGNTSCLQCDDSISPCVIDTDVINPITIVITTPVVINGDFNNFGDVKVIVQDGGTLEVTGCLFIHPNSTFIVDVTGVDQSSEMRFTVIQSSCINGSVEVISDDCVDTLQEVDSTKLDVLTIPTDECKDGNTLPIIIGVVLGILLVVFVLIIFGIIYIPCMRHACMPWTLRKTRIRPASNSYHNDVL